MATTETEHAPDQTERSGRRRPFTSWMKKLANFKSSSFAATASDGNNHSSTAKRNAYQMKMSSKKSATPKNACPEPNHVNVNLAPVNVDSTSSTVPTVSLKTASPNPGDSVRTSEDGLPPPTIGNKSTTAASMGRANSEAAPSHAPSSAQGTNGTVGFGLRGNDSTFSSPAPSVRSLTTTLTTLHSAAPTASTPNNLNTNHATVQFSHQFPSSSPLNALPMHMTLQSNNGNPSTYNSAIANNLLTDNASILTLASSSKRRRKRSIDTDASVRALAPSSLFGGSRESLPLSVLSANIDPIPHQPRPSVGGLNERGSIYSMAGATPTLPSERNSFYAGKQPTATDAGSIRSSPLNHTRNESVNGGTSAFVAQGNAQASPRDAAAPSLSRIFSQSDTTHPKDDEEGIREEATL